MHTERNLGHGSTILLIHENELASFLHHPQLLKKYLFKIDIESFIDMVFVKKKYTSRIIFKHAKCTQNSKLVKPSLKFCIFSCLEKGPFFGGSPSLIAECV